jgi:hypothetical protein
LAIAADALFLIAFLFVIPQGSAVVFVLASIFCRHSDLSLSKAKNPRIRSLPLPVLFELRPPFLTSRPTPSLRLTYALRDSIG